MNDETKRELDSLSQIIQDKYSLILLFPHFEFDHVLINEHNVDIFHFEDYIRMLVFKTGMN